MSWMEMIYIDKENNARKTGVGAKMETQAKTWAAFNSARRLEVPSDKAEFLLDYYNRFGNLCDTILLSRAGFEEISREVAKSDDEYRKIDTEYWAKEKDLHQRSQP